MQRWSYLSYNILYFRLVQNSVTMISSYVYNITSPIPDITLRNETDIVKLEDLSMAVFIVTLVASVISIISAIVLVCAFWRYRERNTQNTLIICLTIANGLTCVGIVMGAFHYEKDIPFGNSASFCLAQSVICTYFDVVADIYTLYVEIKICSQLAFSHIFMERRLAKIFYHALALIIPVIIVSVGLSRNALGESASLYGSWCWISDSLPHKERWIWMVVTKQGWEVVVYLGTCFMFIIIGYQRNCRNKRRVLPSHYDVYTEEISTVINLPDERTQLTNSSNSSQNSGYTASSVNSVLVWVGMYFYFAKMWGTFRYGVHIYSLAFGGNISWFDPAERHFFIFAQSLGDSLQATITCCVFVLMNSELRRKLCCRRSISAEQSINDHQT